MFLPFSTFLHRRSDNMIRKERKEKKSIAAEASRKLTKLYGRSDSENERRERTYNRRERAAEGNKRMCCGTVAAGIQVMPCPWRGLRLEDLWVEVPSHPWILDSCCSEWRSSDFDYSRISTISSTLHSCLATSRKSQAGGAFFSLRILDGRFARWPHANRNDQTPESPSTVKPFNWFKMSTEWLTSHSTHLGCQPTIRRARLKNTVITTHKTVRAVLLEINILLELGSCGIGFRLERGSSFCSWI